MNEQIISLLKEYGLKEKEIKIFIILVENNELTAYRIAKLARIHRSTTYDILERLISKGFINKKEKNKKVYYSTNEISSIITKLKDKESILTSLIPQFEKLEKTTKSDIRILEDVDGQKQFNFNLFNQISEGKINEIYVIGNGPAQHLSSQLFLEKLLKEAKKKRIHKKIKYKGIWDEKFKNNKLVKIFSKFGEDKFLKNIPTKVTTVIFGEYLAYLFTIDKIPQVIEIKNKLITEEMKVYFNYLWKLSKP